MNQFVPSGNEKTSNLTNKNQPWLIPGNMREPQRNPLTGYGDQTFHSSGGTVFDAPRRYSSYNTPGGEIERSGYGQWRKAEMPDVTAAKTGEPAPIVAGNMAGERQGGISFGTIASDFVRQPDQQTTDFNMEVKSGSLHPIDNASMSVNAAGRIEKVEDPAVRTGRDVYSEPSDDPVSDVEKPAITAVVQRDLCGTYLSLSPEGFIRVQNECTGRDAINTRICSYRPAQIMMICKSSNTLDRVLFVEWIGPYNNKVYMYLAESDWNDLAFSRKLRSLGIEINVRGKKVILERLLTFFIEHAAIVVFPDAYGWFWNGTKMVYLNHSNTSYLWKEVIRSC